ncbi:putative alpha-1,2-mannosidase [Runella defluvii]|uniref:Putative alpha-1,2-mannosidase n=1 Tax=Runella defluvii TaxID=370973 RepID=A0A7W5ZJ01_9BACT|nr:GH92 family glycosyl hydrolase [Runella defluvii]MBB3837713.1 putative alpha-1,2-mannosidase [Runella defluvii]
MKRLLLLVGLLPLVCFAQKTPVDYVNPLIGSAPSTTESARRHSEGASELRGQIAPAIGHPHGMTTWTPQTRATETKCIAPYYYNDPKINGFRATHWLNGSCVQDYGSLTLMPISGKLRIAAADRAASYSHAQEVVSPSYYSVELTDAHIKAEVSATKRSGLLKFTFQDKAPAYLLIEPNSDEGEGYVEIVPDRNELVVYNPVHRIYQGSGQSAGFSGYYVIQFEKPFKNFGTWEGNEIQPRSQKVKGAGNRVSVGAYVEIDITTNPVVNVRVGSSFTDAAGARTNLTSELAHWDLHKVKAQAAEAWNKELGRIAIKGSEQTKTLFYTALYHTKHTPRLFSDVDGRYPGFADDSEIHTTKGFDYYCDFSLWDTFRAGMPLHTLLEPQRSSHFMQSLVTKAEQGGWMPIFPCWNHFTAAMIGDHVASAMADAYAKGIRGFDVQKGYHYLHQNAFTPNADPKSYEAGKGRRALVSYLKYNYIPLEDSVWQAFHKREQTSRTLEYAYDDFCLSTLAKALGKTADYEALRRRALNYKNVIDPATGWARGRYANGQWSRNFDPYATRVPFITEGSPAQYTWFVPHDVQGLIAQVGGRERFIAKLDTMFEQGKYWHGNEPGNHTVYLYAYGGEPWKTQKWVRQLVEEEYSTDAGGLSGNEDGGQMSAWLVFSMVGFYPVCPGKPYYVLGSPSVEEATLRLANGKSFQLIAKKQSPKNRYIRSAVLNGKPLKTAFLTHEQLQNGGVLELEMSETPNLKWGKEVDKLSSY